jgi:hypothetical protein
MLYITLIVVGTVLMALAGIWPSERDKNFWKKLNFWVIILGGAVVCIGSYFSQKELSVKTQELAELQDQTFSMVTGGDSFPYVSLPKNQTMFFIHNTFDFPLYDMVVRVVDVDKLHRLRKTLDTFEQIMGASKFLKVGNLSPNTSQSLDYLPDMNSTGGSQRRFNFFITARNGYFVEELRHRKIKGLWKSALRVKKGKKEVFQKIDPEFPRNERSEVEW